ncbi:MAG: ATP-binding protein [Bacteroidetes bacterium]|nr:ATP-binding protein [Bacteroidota bacterium]
MHSSVEPEDAAMEEYEKLGLFYLGKVKAADGAEGPLLLYDAKDLTTHALCVGMTGSGKTGLCLGLLEEAAIDGIPALVIDPKGDIGNLLLTFPELRAQDFRPWIDEAEAARKGMTADAFAAATAENWKQGLAGWGQDGTRIARLRAATDMAIYTPGSSAGLPLSVLRSFSAPAEAQREDADAMRERILSTVSGLLALLGIDADPLQSREHILLSNILDTEWRQGRDLGIADVIRAILSPPFTQLGVFDLESFYPEKERRALAMQLNNVLASPGFAAWMEGDPLDIGALLYTPEGLPRVAILSIAHLSDAERMFFVTIVLNELLGWMRRQSGTSSLRAMFYMDEIFGYFPPTANPPSKQPMLTLLKQARAFGVGCVLATQNPVDLDYKGLGNTGTWFIGRLQTERDKLRVLDGLEGATAAAGKAFDRATLDATLSGLGKRVFLMNNVHDDAPVLFETRWAMSYLRGPLTRDQIATLMATREVAETATSTIAGVTAGTVATSGDSAPAGTESVHTEAQVPGFQTGARPVLPGGMPERFLPPAEGDGAITWRPQLHTEARLHFVHARSGLDVWRERTLLVTIPDEGDPDWDRALQADALPLDQDEPAGISAAFAPLPSALGDGKRLRAWEKSFSAWLYEHEAATVYQCAELKAMSAPDEGEREFRIRLSEMLHERRDAEMEKLRERYLTKFSRVQERIRKAEQRVAREEAQYRDQGMAAAVDVGTTLLGALFGRRVSAASAVRRTASRVGRASGERGDIARARADLSASQQELLVLEDQFRVDAGGVQAMDAGSLAIEEIRVAPRKSDIAVAPLALAWTPWQTHADGTLAALWQ